MEHQLVQKDNKDYRALHDIGL